MNKLLLIDDDVDDRQSFCDALKEVAPQYNCETASSCTKALAVLETMYEEFPDLIFIDINMPIISGWQCLSMLKNRPLLNAIPIIIYSTSSFPEDAKKAKSLGALCFFSKPDNYKKLKTTLGIIIQHLCSNTLYSINESLSYILC